MDLNAIASVVVNTALAIHKQFGPGLLESAYEALMLHMLEQHGVEVRRQVPIPLIFNGVELGEVAYRADLVINGKLIVELKSVTKLQDVHSKQLLTYLKLADMRLGLLINFGCPLLKENVVRIINGSLN